MKTGVGAVPPVVCVCLCARGFVHGFAFCRVLVYVVTFTCRISDILVPIITLLSPHNMTPPFTHTTVVLCTLATLLTHVCVLFRSSPQSLCHVSLGACSPLFDFVLANNVFLYVLYDHDPLRQRSSFVLQSRGSHELKYVFYFSLVTQSYPCFLGSTRFCSL